MRTRWITWLNLFLICLWPWMATGARAQTEGSLSVEVGPPQVQFGQSLRFPLAASSSADITSAVLVYRPMESQGTTVEQADLEPSTQLQLIHEVDLTNHPLKPFIEVEYWWTVSDTAGQKHTTEHQRFLYEDNRFDWQSLPGRQVEVHWYDRDPTFGPRTLDIADRAADRILDMIDPELSLSLPLHLHLYASESDLLAALPKTGREWTVGQAYPELGLAVVAIPPGPESTSTMRRLIPHELTHLILYEAACGSHGSGEICSRYNRLPPWLNEGLAVVSEEIPNPDNTLVLDRALQNDQLLPLDSLCHSFPYQDSQVHLAYAQSASVVQFIQKNYGHSATTRLVALYGDDLSCPEGIRRALGISWRSLESQWRESLGARSPGTALLKQAAPWLLLVLISLPLLLLIAGPLAARRREQPRERLL